MNAIAAPMNNKQPDRWYVATYEPVLSRSAPEIKKVNYLKTIHVYIYNKTCVKLPLKRSQQNCFKTEYCLMMIFQRGQSRRLPDGVHRLYEPVIGHHR